MMLIVVQPDGVVQVHFDLDEARRCRVACGGKLLAVSSFEVPGSITSFAPLRGFAARLTLGSPAAAAPASVDDTVLTARRAWTSPLTSVTLVGIFPV